MRTTPAAVVGAGPNGLAAAITLARAGCDVTLYEAADVIGGGMRSRELTGPGFVHDICSAIHPLAISSPFFRSVPLDQFGLEWIQPPIPLAHPLDDGSAALLDRSLDATCEGFGTDGDAYRSLYAPLVRDWEPLMEGLLAPIFPPQHPLVMARFGLHAIRSARGLATSRFRSDAARAMFAGIAAHSLQPLEATATASFALTIGMLGHVWGWPLPRGGSRSLATALASYFTSLGGKIVTGLRITSAAQVADARLVLFDVMPRHFIEIAGEKLASGYRWRLARYRHAPAAFKVDWALDGPIPWRATDCMRAGTVHLGGTIDEIARSEHASHVGQVAERPFVLLAQQSLFDDTRAPAGKHTAWAYCHVPHGSSTDMTERVEAQVERFAPGFRDLVIGRHVMTPLDFEAHNANYIGGDIVGGANTLVQLLSRPVLRIDPYATPVKGWYLCSAATPPGGGVHGMGGYHAARSALKSIGIAS